eukprot:2524849-Ditylum_brightwellii.AAC.1
MYSAILASRDPKEVALDAYRKQIEPYHRWALCKVFTLKLLASRPLRDKFLAILGNFKSQDFGEEEEQIILNDLGKLVSIWRPIVI